MTSGRDNIVVPGWSAISRTPASTAIAAAPHEDPYGRHEAFRLHRPGQQPGQDQRGGQQVLHQTNGPAHHCQDGQCVSGVTRAGDAAATATDSDPTDHRNQVPFTWSGEGPASAW